MDFSKVTQSTDSALITRAYLDQILVEPRYLDSCVPDIRMELYGKTFSSPVMIAAFSHLSGTHPGGMPEMACGAAAAGCCNWAGMGSREELTDILSTGASTVKIIKPYADRKRVFDMIAFACQSGCLAVGMDIDHSFGGDGLPDNVLGDAMKPVSQAELKDFIAAADRPFIVKGVLSVPDAEKCAEAGAKGLLISHHHGIMPCAVPPLMILKDIRRAVGEDLDLFIDGSIQSGIDAFKCLAMGAKAVCVGRAILDRFRASGSEGVCEYLTGMKSELRAMMARTGSPDLNRIAKDVLWDGASGTRIHI